MAWLRTHIGSRWQWITLNAAALGVFVYVLMQGDAELSGSTVGFDSMLATGEWGVRWLMVSLAMTPLHTFLHWRGALKLRKSAGLWAFAFGMAHLVIYARVTWEPYPVYRTGPTPWAWLAWPMQPYMVLGLISLLILTALAITSNRWAMAALGKGWKRLHRLVYCAGVAILTHALLATTMSKRVMIRDPQAATELQIYLGILAVLLIVRVPQVRARLLKRTAKRPMRVVEGVAPRVVPMVTSPGRHLPQSPTLHVSPVAPVPDTTQDAVEREPVA
jgi:methionine sulfoxide reductase heme-binding subunit